MTEVKFKCMCVCTNMPNVYLSVYTHIYACTYKSSEFLYLTDKKQVYQFLNKAIFILAQITQISNLLKPKKDVKIFFFLVMNQFYSSTKQQGSSILHCICTLTCLMTKYLKSNHKHQKAIPCKLQIYTCHLEQWLLYLCKLP